jgi:hypothetical protein
LGFVENNVKQAFLGCCDGVTYSIIWAQNGISTALTQKILEEFRAGPGALSPEASHFSIEGF